MKYIPIQFTKEIFTKAQVPPNSYNYILDGMYAIYFYHSKIYMKNILKELGFKKFQELEDDSIDINNNVLRNEIRIMCYK